MLQMEMPHVNVVSKIDKVASYDPLPFDLGFYTDVDGLSYLMPHLEAETPAIRSGKFSKLNGAVADLIESFGLVRYEVLAVENKKSMMHLLRVVDRAGGYVFGGAEGANDTVWQVAMQSESSLLDVPDLQERWIDCKEEYDEMEQRDEEDYLKMMNQAAAPADGRGSISGAPGEDGDEDFEDMQAYAKLDSGIRVERVAK